MLRRGASADSGAAARPYATQGSNPGLADLRQVCSSHVCASPWTGAWWGFTSRSCEEIDTDHGVCEASQSAPRRRLELRQAQSCRYDNYAYTLLDAMVKRGARGARVQWGPRGAKVNLNPAPEPESGPEPEPEPGPDPSP